MNNLTEIIEACAKNNAVCQKLLYQRFYGYSLKIVMGYIHQYDKAVDVMNDGFVKVFRNIHLFISENEEETEKRFKGWMKRIMINGAIDQLRKKNFHEQLVSLDNQDWENYSAPSMADERLITKDIFSMVSKLPPASQAVFNLVVIEGMTHKETANLLGIAESTSKSNLNRAKSHLQRMLSAYEYPVAC